VKKRYLDSFFYTECSTKQGITTTMSNYCFHCQLTLS